MKKWLLAFALFLIVVLALDGQQVFSLFQSGRAVPGAAVGDLYCTSTTTGIIVPFHIGNNTDILSVDTAATPCKLRWVTPFIAGPTVTPTNTPTNTPTPTITPTPTPGGVVSGILSSSKPPGTLATAHLEYQSVAASATQTLLTYSGGDGYVSELFVAITCTDGAARGSSHIKIYLNGSGTATIDQPINQFMGAVYTGTDTASTHLVQSRYVSANGGASANVASYAFYLPIPFTGGVKVDFANGSTTTTATIFSTIKYHTGVSNTWPYTKKLKIAAYSSGSGGCTINAETTLMDDSSAGVRGRMAGLSLLIDGVPNSTTPRDAPQEGNVKIYLDGSGTASYESSGTEDYFGFGYNSIGMRSENANPGNWHGTGFWSNTGTADNTVSYYRFHVDDPIVFNSGLKVTWACGNTAEVSFTGKPVVYATVWYYTE